MRNYVNCALSYGYCYTSRASPSSPLVDDASAFSARFVAKVTRNILSICRNFEN